MCNIRKELDKVIDLTPAENSLLFGHTKRKTTRFESIIPILEPTKNYQLSFTSIYQETSLIILITTAIKEAELFLVNFPDHEKPPDQIFEYTMSAFMHRRNAVQVNLDFYYGNNMNCLNVAKLYVEYRTIISYFNSLLDSLVKTSSFKKFQADVTEMIELENYLVSLDKGNIENIAHLRKQELHLIKLCQNNKSSFEFIEFDSEFVKLENDLTDNRIIAARQKRYNKNLFNSQMVQIKRRQLQKTSEITNENNELMRSCEAENLVFAESSRCNYLMMEDYKRQIHEISEKYENDLIHVETEVTRLQSDLIYFEEMWERKMQELKLMKDECEKYIESVRQRNREAIAKRLAKPWIASARKTIAIRKKKAKRLAKKEKEANKRKR